LCIEIYIFIILSLINTTPAESVISAQLNKQWRETMDKETALFRATEMLKAIAEQWTIKNLAGDFFILPYELDDFIAELRSVK